jgi:hypothetical protein
MSATMTSGYDNRNPDRELDAATWWALAGILAFSPFIMSVIFMRAL